MTTFLTNHGISAAVAAFFAGGSATRALVYVSGKMPPLPEKSGWWTQFFYACIKGASGLDPSATVTPPPNHK